MIAYQQAESQYLEPALIWSWYSMSELDRKPSPLILILDDSPSDLRLLSSFIKDQGKIIFATDSAEGLRLAQMRQPDLIILNNQFKDIDGQNLGLSLKKRVETQHIPCLFILPNMNTEEEIRALENGAVDVISKPLNPAIVGARVKTQITNAKQAIHLRQFAHRDEQTGLLDLSHFNLCLQQEWNRHLRQQIPLTLALVHPTFTSTKAGANQIQQHLSHLKALGKLIRKATRRPGELSARLDDNTLACLLPATSHEEAEKFSYYLQNLLNNNQQNTTANTPSNTELASKEGNTELSQLSFTIKMGVATVIPEAQSTLQDLVLQARKHLEQAFDQHDVVANDLAEQKQVDNSRGPVCAEPRDKGSNFDQAGDANVKH